MSPTRTEDERGTHSFPRVSGDEPSWAVISPFAIAFSPRERG